MRRIVTGPTHSMHARHRRMTLCLTALRPIALRPLVLHPFTVRPLVAALGIATALAAASPARASSEAAWSEHRRDVVNACVEATELRQARPAGDLVEFDDRIGLTALVVTGIEAPRKAKPRRTRVLCIFDRKTRYAQVADADALLTLPTATKPKGR
jgi:ribosomal protein L14